MVMTRNSLVYCFPDSHSGFSLPNVAFLVVAAAVVVNERNEVLKGWDG